MIDNRRIYVTFTAEAVHHFPGAVHIPGVEFLAQPHRHLFHFKISVDVRHNDRDVEFIDFKRKVEDFVGSWPMDVGTTSCEQMAEQIISFIVTKVGLADRWIEVDVSEDGENGAVVCYRPDIAGVVDVSQLSLDM